jgi:DNA-binding response OmpR family regulator
MKILIVEDSRSSAGLLSHFLEKEGYEVQVVGTLGEAFPLAAEGGPTSCSSTASCPTGTASSSAGS